MRGVNTNTSRYITALSILREAERVNDQLDGCSILAGLATYQDLLRERSYLDYSSILDDDQTIYQWRGSDVDNILTFAERYPGVEQVPLEQNFRSSQGKR